MSLSREEIAELALRYIPEDEIIDFPQEEELLCFMERTVPKGKKLKDSEGWRFGGYGICKGYEYDFESKPKGKWVWFYFVSLNTFPPTKQCLKLQPPHIARGRFENADRSGEMKIVRIPDYFQEIGAEYKNEYRETTDPASNDNIIPFPRKKL